MKREEFMPQFERLCKGFKLEPTIEQAEAWYRRIGHVGLAPWAESVTTLLCARYFPKLEEALEEVEQEAERLRKAAVVKDQASAKKTYTLIKTGAIKTPDISMPFFKAIKAYAGRQQARQLIVITEAHIKLNDLQDQALRACERRIAEWRGEILKYDHELIELVQQLTPDENRDLIARYEAA